MVLSMPRDTLYFAGPACCFALDPAPSGGPDTSMAMLLRQDDATASAGPNDMTALDENQDRAAALCRCRFHALREVSARAAAARETTAPSRMRQRTRPAVA